MDKKEFKQNISKIINDSKLPNEIQKEIKNICMKYEESYIQCVEDVSIAKNKRVNELFLKTKTEKDDMYDFIKTVVRNEYGIKNLEMLNRVFNEIDSENQKKDLLFISRNPEEEKRSENTLKNRIKEDIVNYKDNASFIKSILGTINSEMQSAEKSVITILESLKLKEQNIETKQQISRIKEQWTENIHDILKRAKEEIPEFENVLQQQEQEIYNNIETTIKIYQQENDNLEENRVKDFRTSISKGIHIDEKKALEDTEKKEYKEEQKLSRDILK